MLNFFFGTNFIFTTNMIDCPGAKINGICKNFMPVAREYPHD